MRYRTGVIDKDTSASRCLLKNRYLENYNYVGTGREHVCQGVWIR